MTITKAHLIDSIHNQVSYSRTKVLRDRINRKQ